MTKGQDRMSKELVRYSEAFKLQVVDEVGSGRYASPFAAERAYGIGGRGTVSRWMVRYGKSELLRKVTRVETRDEVSEVKRLRARIGRLESALADAHMDRALDHAFLEILCERTGTDLDSFKKKHAETLSRGRGTRSGRSGE